jgi:hypothetical protein
MGRVCFNQELILQKISLLQNTMKSILDFDHEEVRTFFLKEESYFNFDLPTYFTFGNLLNDLSDAIDGHEIESFYKNIKSDGSPKRPFPSELEGVNYLLLNNKDGKYAWRPFQLIHPALYVALVHEITKEDNWNIICERFEEFQNNPKIKCQSIPVESEDELSDKANAITNWWQKIEQESIALALEYEYVLHTDITDCYGSIYTHSIPWAVHTKVFAKQHRSTTYVGNAIDKYIRDMSYGQTNGIPVTANYINFLRGRITGQGANHVILPRTVGKTRPVIDDQVERIKPDIRIAVGQEFVHQ